MQQERQGKTGSFGEGGFTLLETLLAVSLSAILAAFLVSTMQVWAESEKAEASRTYVESIADAVGDMTGNYEQFSALFDHIESLGGALQIGILDSDGVPDSLQSGVWNGSVQIVPGSPRITDDYAETNPVKQSFSVVIAATRRGVSGEERGLEILVVSEGVLREEDARTVAERMGANGGIISARTVSESTECMPSGCDMTVRGIFNDWKMDVSLFSGTTWESTVITAPPSVLEGAYLVFHRYLTAQEVAGDYLYRIPVEGSPEINRMHTDLDMSGNSLIGVDNIRVSDIEVSDYISAGGSVSIGGSFNAAQMVVNGTTRAGSMQMAKTHDTADSRVDENYNGRVTNTISVDGSVSASSVSVSSLEAGSASAGSLSSPMLTASSVSNSGSLLATNMTAETVNTQTSESETYNYYGNGGTFVLPDGQFRLRDLAIGRGYVQTLDTGSLSGTVTSGETSIGNLTGCSGC